MAGAELIELWRHHLTVAQNSIRQHGRTSIGDLHHLVDYLDRHRVRHPHRRRPSYAAPFGSPGMHAAGAGAGNDAAPGGCSQGLLRVGARGRTSAHTTQPPACARPASTGRCRPPSRWTMPGWLSNSWLGPTRSVIDQPAAKAAALRDVAMVEALYRRRHAGRRARADSTCPASTPSGGCCGCAARADKDEPCRWAAGRCTRWTTGWPGRPVTSWPRLRREKPLFVGERGARIDPRVGAQGGAPGAAGGDRSAGSRATRPPARDGHPPARRRRGPAQRPGDARSQLAGHDPDLHPRDR